MTPTTLPNEINFYFDPICPWTWATARWAVDMAPRNNVKINWRSLSLAVLNKGKHMSEKLAIEMQITTAAHRIIAAMRADDQNDLIGEFYTEFGRQIHHDGATQTLDLVRAIAKTAGADKWADEMDNEKWDEAIESSTNHAIELSGPDVGSPVIGFDTPEIGTFGPIVSPPPTGTDADDLFEVFVRMIRLPGVYEIKHGRTGAAIFGPRP